MANYMEPLSDVFMIITAAAGSELNSLIFRDGYAPFVPFTGRLDDEVSWAIANRARLPVLLQPLGLWGSTSGYNKSGVQVALTDEGPAFPNMMRLPLHWIHDRRSRQHAPSLEEFWRSHMRCEPPAHLYHAQGAQFSLSRRAIHSRPRDFYMALIDQLLHIDPVESYYLELMWWYIFDEDAAHICVVNSAS